MTFTTLNSATYTAAELIEKIGNVVEAVEVDSVLYTLAADAVFRANDAEVGLMIACWRCPSMAVAKAHFDKAVADAKAVA